MVDLIRGIALILFGVFLYSRGSEFGQTLGVISFIIGALSFFGAKRREK